MPPYKRIIVKLGTSLLTGGTGHLDHDMISRLAAQVAALHKQGFEIVIVTSGAVAAGREKLGVNRRRGVAFKQVLASVGQSRLMNVYEQLFAAHGITVAQALLTKAVLIERAGYLNARNTLLSLLEMGIICIVNENDVVAVDELHEARFGDNDNLSAMVANLVDADLLLILTDIAGLYTADPHLDPEARLIPEVRQIDSSIECLVGNTTGNLGIGGMVTKLEAARLATACGVCMVIADGRLPDVIPAVVRGEAIGTRFVPSTSKLESRQRWMLSGLCTKGRLVIDSGAVRALKEDNRSLLAAGIAGISGEFEHGDIVDIYSEGGERVGCGISNYGSHDITVIRGMHSTKIATLLGYDYGAEVVHRNNLVVL